MRNTFSLVSPVLLVGTLVGLCSAPAMAAPLTVDYVDSAGRSWADLVETTFLTWNQVSAVCAQDGVTACTGNIGALETTGWVWATRQQVSDLFLDLGVPGGALPNPAVQPASPWAPAIISLFGATGTSPAAGFQTLRGWTSTLAVPTNAYVGAISNFDEPSFTDVATLADTFAHPIVSSNSNVGVWLFRPAAVPVPEPASLLLIGTGLIGLAHRLTRRGARASDRGEPRVEQE